MNEFRTYQYSTRFHPPGEGLMSGESIVWTRRAGIGFWTIFCGVTALILAPFLFVFTIEEFGLSNWLPLLAIVPAGFIILIARIIRTKRTRYYLTNERILETRGGRVIKEIPLHHFAGKPIGQFLETRVTHTSNDRPIYQIQIYDPVSDDVLEIKGWTKLQKSYPKLDIL